MGLRRILGKVGRGWCPLVGVAMDGAKNEEERKAIGTSAILFGSIFFVASMVAAHIGLKRYENLMNQVVIKADTNKDGIVSEDERAKVYEKLGIEYDPENPRFLSENLLKFYLRLQPQQSLKTR